MRCDGIDGVLVRLLDHDPAVAERDDVLAAIRDLTRIQSWTEAALLQCKRRLDVLHVVGESESATSALIAHGSMTGRDARAAEERDQVCDEHPPLEDALATGRLSAAHLDVLARHTRKLTDAERSDLHAAMDDVTAWATSDHVTVFERRVKQLVAAIRAMHRPGNDADELDRQRSASHMKRWTDRDSGLEMTLLAMDPLRDASFHTAHQAHLNRLRSGANADVPFGSLQIDAVLAAMSTDEPRLRIPEVVIHVDRATVKSGQHSNSLCETIDGETLPAITVQRLCCEAVISAVVIADDGQPVRLLTDERTANRAQRRALATMYRTCAHPHCEITFSQCRIHHIMWWSRGGRTELTNLLPLCEQHHHLVHEGRWNLTITDDRTLTWIRPDGTIWRTDRNLDRLTTRQPDLGSVTPFVENRQPSLC